MENNVFVHIISVSYILLGSSVRVQFVSSIDELRRLKDKKVTAICFITCIILWEDLAYKNLNCFFERFWETFSLCLNAKHINTFRLSIKYLWYGSHSRLANRLACLKARFSWRLRARVIKVNMIILRKQQTFNWFWTILHWSFSL